MTNKTTLGNEVFMKEEQPKIQIGKIELQEEINHKGEKYIYLKNANEEGMGLNEEETKELESLLREFLYKCF